MREATESVRERALSRGFVVLGAALLAMLLPSVQASPLVSDTASSDDDCGRNDGPVTGTIKWAKCVGREGYKTAWGYRTTVWSHPAVWWNYWLVSGPVCGTGLACPGYPPDHWAFHQLMGPVCDLPGPVCVSWCLLDPECGGPI